MSQMTDIVMIVLLGGGAIYLFGTPHGQELLNNLMQKAQAATGGGGGGGDTVRVGADKEGKGGVDYNKRSFIWNTKSDKTGFKTSPTDWGIDNMFPGTVPPGVDPVTDLNLKPETPDQARARINPADPNQSWINNPGKRFGGAGYNGDDQDIGDDGEIITGANSYVYANSMADAAYDNITGFV